MLDRSVHLSFAVSILLWMTGFGIVIADLTLPTDDWGHLGLALCCLAVAANLHGVLLRLSRSLCRDAFEMGRDAGRGEAAAATSVMHRVR